MILIDYDVIAFEEEISSYLIDTNCLISYTTTRNKKQTEKISEHIDDASSQKSDIIIISEQLNYYS